ncbi:hypothetical protein, partial [Caldibacillus thermoamylovorans]|uniref:hypothetical protein n=1 Tax=Caldibacillus thermoamylovorans TaxID=35841 RepID=UPI001D08B57A
MATRPNLVTNLGREMLFFGDETRSRHHFEEKKALFWRRDRISSPFWGRKRSILTTRPNLVTNLRRRKPIFDDETESRRHFGARNTQFWRRTPISSPFWGGKRSILATRPNLVTNLRRRKPIFDDETE